MSDKNDKSVSAREKSSKRFNWRLQKHANMLKRSIASVI